MSSSIRVTGNQIKGLSISGETRTENEAAKITFGDDSVAISNLVVNGSSSRVNVTSEDVVFQDAAIRLLPQSTLSEVGSAEESFSSVNNITTSDWANDSTNNLFNVTASAIQFGAGESVDGTLTNATSIVALRDEFRFVVQNSTAGSFQALDLFEFARNVGQATIESNAEDGLMVEPSGTSSQIAFNTTVNMPSDVVMSGTLGVTGAVTLGNTLAVSETLDVSGSANLQDGLTVGGISYLKSTLEVSGNTTLQQNLTVNGFTAIYDNVDVSENVSIQGRLDVTGATSLNDTLTVSNAATLNSTLAVSSTLDVSGATTLKSTLDVTGEATFQSNVIVSGALDVSGVTILRDTLSVSNAATFSSTVAVDSTLDVTAATTLNDTLTVGAIASFGADLDVSGNTNLQGTLSVDEAVTFNSTLSVSGQSAFRDDVLVYNDNGVHIYTLDQGAPGQQKQIMLRGDEIIFKSTANVQNGGFVRSDDASANLQIGVTTTEEDTGDPSIAVRNGASGREVQIYHQTVFDDTLGVSGTATFDGAVNISGAADLEGTLNVSGVATFQQDLGVTGNAQVDGDMIFGGNVDITSGDLSMTGSINLEGGGISVTGNLDVTGEGAFSSSVTAASFDTSSDSRLKKEVVDIEGALDSVKAMRGVRYNWVDPEKPQREVGVIAQEVKAQYPEIVRERDNGFLVVDYSRLCAVLIQAVKELEARVAALEQ